MTRFLRLALPFVALLGLAACGQAEAATEGSPDAHEMVANGATLLDVRTPGEYARGHVEGSINIPVQELEQRIAEVPEGEAVVVYCQSGVRSASAARTLRSHGYEVHDLGSMSAW